MNSFQSVTTLKGHSGLVKGVAWDPVNKTINSFAFTKKIISISEEILFSFLN